MTYGECVAYNPRVEKFGARVERLEKLLALTPAAIARAAVGEDKEKRLNFGNYFSRIKRQARVDPSLSYLESLARGFSLGDASALLDALARVRLDDPGQTSEDVLQRQGYDRLGQAGSNKNIPTELSETATFGVTTGASFSLGGAHGDPSLVPDPTVAESIRQIGIYLIQAAAAAELAARARAETPEPDQQVQDISEKKPRRRKRGAGSR